LMDVGDSCSYTSKLTITLFFHSEAVGMVSCYCFLPFKTH